MSRGARRRAEADLFGDPRSERVGDVLHPFDSDAGIVGGLPTLDLLLGEAEAGRNSEAADAYLEALNLARTDAERRYLTKRLREVSTGPAPAEAEGA